MRKGQDRIATVLLWTWLMNVPGQRNVDLFGTWPGVHYYKVIIYNPSIPTYWNEDTSIYSGTPLFQHPEMRTPLYTVEPLYSHLLRWGHFYIQWNPSIPTPWNEDTSAYSGTPLFPLTEMRTLLYTVEPLYSNSLKWGHLCIKDTLNNSLCINRTSPPEMRPHSSNQDTLICPKVSGIEKLHMFWIKTSNRIPLKGVTLTHCFVIPVVITEVAYLVTLYFLTSIIVFIKDMWYDDISCLQSVSTN